MSLMEKMTLEQFKQQVEQCLIGRSKDTTGAQKLMKSYKDDFPEFLSMNLTPQEAAGFITANY